MIGRVEEWDRFSSLVRNHIEKYTIPQYGDVPNDQLSEYRPIDCLQQVSKYIHRHFTNQRGDVEKQRDLFKMAHYICVTFFKE